MRPQDDIDFTTLAWVKGELDETLKQARQALEAYVEDPSDISQMRFCATYLHQVQGTLRMVELYGAAMVTEEMEHLAAALLDGQVAEKDEAYAALMRGMVQLPDYLERLQSGHKDIPIVLLPLLNDLRAARGEKSLSEIALFTPDLGQELPGAVAAPAQPLSDAELATQVEPLRNQFQLALLKWFRNDDVDTSLARLADTCDKLIGLISEEEARRLFWVTAGVLEALRAKAFEPSPQLKQTVGKVEREIKRLVDSGEKSFRADPPRELTRNLLYFVAHAPTQHGRIGELRDVFNLGALLPSQAEIDHARSSLSGHNRSLLDTVSSAIKEDLLRVKDALDLHLRNPSADTAQLADQAEVLDRVSDTLGMLGLGVPRRVVQEQRAAMQAVVDGTRTADESTLLDIAGALLYVEASLDDQVQHLGGVPAGEGGEGAMPLPSIETRRVMQALVKEAQVNFTRAKQCFIGYIESSWDASQLQDAPELLSQVAGALRIVELPAAADYLDAVSRFTQVELLDNRRVPGVVQMETLADALASLEYFLEAQAELRPGRDRILVTAQSSLEKLGYWPIPSSEAAALAPDSALDDPAFDATAALVQSAQDAAHATPAETPAAPAPVQASEPEPEQVPEPQPAAPAVGDTTPPPAVAVPEPVAAEPMPATPAEPATPEVAEPAAAEEPAADGIIIGGFEATSDEIDEEIREVFVEEVEEEIENLGELLGGWLENPGNLEQVKSIRRVFHTLKGSGRLVGALTLGEFSWKVENMLNRVLDNTIQPTQPVLELVQAANDVLPEVLAALRGERSVRTDLEAIKDVADRLAAGEQARYVPAPPAAEAVAAPVVPVDVVVPETAAPQIEAPSVPEPEAPTADAPAEEPAQQVAAELEEALAAFEPDADADIGADSAAPETDRIAVAAIDAVLFDILKPEVSGHLDTVDAFLAQGERPVDDALVRAVHTMNGAFAMTEVPVVTEVTAPLENYLKRALAHGLALSPAGASALGDATRALRNVLEELDSPAPRLTPLSDIAARIVAERDQLPDATGTAVPAHPADDAGDMPDLSTAVSVDLGEDLEQTLEQLDDAIAAPASAESGQDEITETAGAQDEAAHAAAGDEPFDAVALDALGGQDIALDGIGLDGIAQEAAAFLADGAATTPQAEAGADFAAPAEGISEEDTPAASQPDVAEADDTPDEVPAAIETEWVDLVSSGTTASETPSDDWLDVVESGFDSESVQPEPLAVDDPSVADEPAAPLESIDPAASEPDAAEEGVDDMIRRWLADESAASQEQPAATPHDTTEPEAETPEAEALSSGLVAGFVDATADADASTGEQAAGADAAAEEPQASEIDASPAETGGIVSADTFFETSEPVELPAAEAFTPDIGIEIEGFDVDSLEQQSRSDDGDTPVDAGVADAQPQPGDMDEPEEVRFEDVTFEDATPAQDVAETDAAAESADEAAISSVEEAAEPAETDAAALEPTVADIAVDAITEAVETSDDAPQEISASEPAISETDSVETEDDVLAAAQEAPQTGAVSSRDAQLAAYFLAGLDVADPDPEGPLMLADMDEELLDIFVEEATDILDHSDGFMVQLRESPNDQEVVVALQRDLHTLKGGARMAGIHPIGDLGHVMESLLEIVAEGKRELPSYGIDVLELAFDRLNRLTARVSERRALTSPTLLIQRVEMLARGEEPELELDELVPEIAAETVAPEAVAAAVEAAVAEPTALDLAPTALDDEDVGVRAPQEQIRIRADLLDRLVNYAGEVAIYRARLEQQLGLFRGNLAELEQTTERLRGQLRKLEIETEAQIVARYQREAEMGGEETFDPLELDRFSTLQQLSRALSESAADLVSLQSTLEDHTRQYETLLLQQSRVSSDLQEGLMRTRMVPFDSLVPRMRRIIRQTAAELGKKAQLKVEGAQGEMDRSVLDRMTAPLEHMLRNALAHGLETPEERRAAGKPEEGTIKVSVLREGSEVVIKVTDDGRGLDRDAIRRKAIDRGLLAADAQVSDQALYGFILESGFSTASSVSKVAGRGVGMDVVHSEIRQLGGTLGIDSERGKGSVFTTRLPFTLAVTQAVFVEQGDTSYAVPIASVQGVARIDRSELDAQLASGSPTFVYAGEDYQIHDLGKLLGQGAARAEDSLQVPLLLARSGDLRSAICVDHVIGSREIVVKPVGAQVSSIPGIFGATIMGDGRVIVILDVAPLVRRYNAQARTDEPEVVVPAAPVRRVPLVMVVDDSITMRKVTGRVLERHNYEVLTAKDGVDAIEKLTDRVPDVMLLDIEMPRMDGYELATHMRNDVRLRGIPIIMITSRTGEKHRQRAFEIGVDRYLGKPYQEADLMRNVDEILKVQRGDLG